VLFVTQWLLAACGPGDGAAGDEKATAEGSAAVPTAASPAPSPAATAGDSIFYPAGASSGVESVDVVITAVTSGDVDTLVDLAKFTLVPCGDPPLGSGQLVCDDGRTPGTRVEVFPSARCQPFFLFSPSELRDALEEAFGLGSLSLYAVYTLDGAGGISTETAYAANFGRAPDDSKAPTFEIGPEGELLGVQLGCGLPGANVPEGAPYLMPPLAPAN
jgi:hypothetical protein